MLAHSTGLYHFQLTGSMQKDSIYFFYSIALSIHLLSPLKLQIQSRSKFKNAQNFSQPLLEATL